MKKSLTYYLTALLLFTSIFGNAQHFETVWSNNPYLPMNAIIQSATIDGLALEIDDEIALFDVDENNLAICIGAMVITEDLSVGNPAIFSAAADDPLTTNIDGFTSGNEIFIQLWDASEAKEIPINSIVFDPSFDVEYTNLGTIIINSITAFSSINTSAATTSNCPGEFIIPIDVSNFINVTDFLLQLNFDPTNISYTTFQNPNPQLSIGTLEVSENNGQILMQWNSMSSLSLGDGPIMELVFMASTVFSQSEEFLSWEENNSFYTNNIGLVYPDEFTNGLISIEPIPVDAGSIIGNIEICQGNIEENYHIDEIINASSYIWEIDPPTSATISGSGPEISIDYSNSYTGQVILSVYGLNTCEFGITSSLVIDIIPKPSSDAGFDATICENVNYTLSGSASNMESIMWETYGDGEFNDPSILNASYSPGSNDIINESVDITLTAIAITPCELNAVDQLSLTINRLSGKPDIPEGPIVVDLNINLISEYITKQTTNTLEYFWYLEPEEAGTIIAVDTNAIVNWNFEYTGLNASIHVSSFNESCNEVSSDTLEISIHPVGINKYEKTKFEISLSPNPTDGQFNILINDANDNIHFIILNSVGQMISKQEILIETGTKTYPINLKGHPSGIYYLKFFNHDFMVNRKLILHTQHIE